MNLLLIRHAQSKNNPLEQTLDYLKGRLADPPLTELGHEQAQRLATWASHDPLFGQVTYLYSSLTTRAVQTAAPLAKALGLKVHGLRDAYECGGLNTGPAGQFAPVAGRDHASLLLDCPALLWPEELLDQGWDGGYEPWDRTRFAQRASVVNSRLRGVYGEGDVIALITHHDFAQFLMADLLGLPALDGEGLRFRLNNTATASIELRAEERVLRWLNRAPHLTLDLLTH